MFHISLFLFFFFNNEYPHLLNTIYNNVYCHTLHSSVYHLDALLIIFDYKVNDYFSLRKTIYDIFLVFYD